MIERKEQNEVGLPLPKKWRNEIADLLNMAYQSECQKQDKTFFVHGLTFPDELVVAVSFMDEKKLEKIPITLILSIDLTDQQRPKELLDILIDSIGVFFDGVFADQDWNEYHLNWEKDTFKGLEIFYQVSRKNIVLYLKAEELLK